TGSVGSSDTVTNPFFAPVRVDSAEHTPDSQVSFVDAVLGSNSRSRVTHEPSQHTRSPPPVVSSACAAATSTLTPVGAPIWVHASPAPPGPAPQPSIPTSTNTVTETSRMLLRRIHPQSRSTVFRP